jgi:hypothetical protein
MQWKFWKRKKDKPGSAEEIDAAQGPETADDTPQSPLTVSSRQILGLQQLIGNQAVLRMMNWPGAEDSERLKQGR